MTDASPTWFRAAVEVPAEVVERGACRDYDPNLFHPTRGQPVAGAIAICKRCPVLEACREHAIPNEKKGVWGGMSERQRRTARVRAQRQIRAELGIGPTGPLPRSVAS